MACLACTLEGRPLPSADAPAVVALLPAAVNHALVAVDDDARRLGAAWWHVHEPPLMLDGVGEPLPELAMAVVALEAHVMPAPRPRHYGPPRSTEIYAPAASEASVPASVRRSSSHDSQAPTANSGTPMATRAVPSATRALAR